MEATNLINSLNSMRANMATPTSHMEIIRQAVQRMSQPVQPNIFNEQQRQVFANKLDILQEFLESEDGADSIELLISSFNSFVESKSV